jgi:hypothetical protein
MTQDFFSLSGMELERWSMNPSEEEVARLESMLVDKRYLLLDWHHLQVLIFVVRRTQDEAARRVIVGLVDHENLAVQSMARDVVREWAVTVP